jgi:ribosomal protein S27E
MSDKADVSPRHRSCDSTFLAIECPRCGDYSERRLVWLRNARAVTCDNCTAAFDLDSGSNRALIDGYFELSARLDAEFGG